MPSGRADAARHRRLRVVGRRQAAAGLHQHAEGLAAEHARRLLGARPRQRDADQQARRQRAAKSSLMFAKFSPDGTRVAYVREQQHLRRARSTTARSTQLTTRRLGRRSSTARPTGSTRKSSTSATASAGVPTASAIAYWQFDTTRRRQLHADQRHRRRSIRRPRRIPYPKAGHARTPRCASASSAPPAARRRG